MFTADTRTGSSDPATGPAAAPAPLSSGDATFGARFDRWYGPVVGLARRIIDPSGATPASLVTAEQVVVDAFAAHRYAIGDHESDDVAQLVCDVADRCLDTMVGHPGTVPLHYEILGPDIDFDGALPLAELHGALNGMRRWDRRVGVLALAAGFSPAQIATLVRRPLDEVIERLGRVCTRLADGRRIGFSDELPAGPS